ncbi:LpxL/LpxP family acyltransferase [Parachitinimonas caeni]|uniref:Acyltransferase n=1 Tax=Parachitinimonas caeni TaxID=3031301 RepID=A0ABT7DXY1_9NEIS|nr:acyltransferase [Parachitinimonas caeni]MDK2124922.1 acyltransferase [Parachitinimonas caeni]
MSTPKVNHWAQMGESTFVFGIWLLYWIHRLLGRWPFRLCLYPVVLMHWLRKPVVRQASQQYLERLQTSTDALGKQPTVRDSLRHISLFAETMLDKLLAVSGRYQFSRVRSGPEREEIYAAAAKGQGGIIVTAHIGCLELCRAIAEQRSALKLNILVHTRHAEQFNRLLKRLNPHNDVNLLEVTEVSPATAVLLNEKIAAGEFVAIAGDRVPVFASQTVSANFLGHQAPFPVGPWILASLLKCPVWLLGCIHDKDGYLIHFERLADSVKLPRGQREAAIAEHVQRYADALTKLLKDSPYDWFNFFPFWDQSHATPASKP